MRSLDQPPAPIGTIGDQVGRHWIWLHCAADGCGHATKYDPADLAERHGAGVLWADFLPRCRCPRCGHRGAVMRLQPPCMPDRSDAPRRV